MPDAPQKAHFQLCLYSKKKQHTTHNTPPQKQSLPWIDYVLSDFTRFEYKPLPLVF